ncbi:MAG: ATP-binding protein [candidate division Zixibacteria bacterium]|nr:ATP-binding protein [candidate division Zixibacteria bacterium]
MEKPKIIDNTIMIPSSQDFLPDVDVFLEGVLRGLGVDESTIADIAISVSELVNNAIFHGNKTARDKTIKVEINKVNGSVKISVTDEGGGFDLNDVENPIDDDNLLKEVGRGLFIVQSLMDSVDKNTTDTGTTVVITKDI